MIAPQAAAIVWAQWRSIMNASSRKRGGRFSIALVFALLWYAMWAFGSFGLMMLIRDPEELDLVRRGLGLVLMLVFLYWQFVPIMMVSTGLSLDLSRLLAYPVPHAQLFGIEVLLRVTTAVEMILIVAGITLGLTLNPALPWWTPLPMIPFVAFNLLFSAGLRDLFARLMARKGFREVVVLVIVLLAAAPQLLLMGTPPAHWRAYIEGGFGSVWPWSNTGRIATATAVWTDLLLLVGWTAAAYAFGRQQFERTLRFDAVEARSQTRTVASRANAVDYIVRAFAPVLRDPFAALFEKELRSLSRSPRFRLLFIMGFSFGLLIWLPVALRSDSGGALRNNYLTVVSAYAIMLLGEICFWNAFGMDRIAVQNYFVLPARMSTVLLAKNCAAAFYILLEVALVALFCFLLRMPVSANDIAEAFCVTVVLTLFLLATGNMLSVRFPRPIDPSQSWRTGSMGRVQGYLLFIYPVTAIPVLLAYGARYAFESGAAFFAVLAIDAAVGLVAYFIAMESACSMALENREYMIQALSNMEGPVGG